MATARDRAPEIGLPLLLQHGANPAALDNKGRSALDRLGTVKVKKAHDKKIQRMREQFKVIRKMIEARLEELEAQLAWEEEALRRELLAEERAQREADAAVASWRTHSNDLPAAGAEALELRQRFAPPPTPPLSRGLGTPPYLAFVLLCFVF